MTAEEKRIVNEMYLAGESPESIGKKLHYHAATIRKNVSPELKRKGCRMYNIVYPGLAKWLAASKMTLQEFADKAGVCSTFNLSIILRGKHNPSKVTIDNILAATGLTYEEAFGSEKDDVDG